MKKILVCDDDEGILEVIKIILESNGYLVECLGSGKAILKKTKEFLPDLILLDLWMSGIGGLEITKILKKDSKTAKIPLVIISAVSDLESIFKKTNADDFLSKPFDMNELLGVAGKYAGQN